jgi:uncharacterized membrane protein YkvA (DUF1232 family)
MRFGRLERFQEKWIPVRVKKTRQNKRLEPGSDAIRTDKALVATSLAWSRSHLGKIKTWARLLKREVHAIYLAAQSPRVPWYTKWLALAVVGYALSPIDLIPDFIPVLGYLDDLIIVPLGVWLVLSLIPEDVMIACRARADEAVMGPHGKIAAFVIIAIWIVGGAVLGWGVLAYWRGTH